MKKLLIAGTAILSVCFTPQLTFAQDVEVEEEVVEPKKAKDWFVYADANIGMSQFSTSEGNTTYVSDNMANAYFRAGLKYKYFGAEVEYGTGVNEIDEDGVTLGLGSQTSFFGILRYPGPDNKYDAFIRAGYHSSDFEVSIEEFDFNLNQNVTLSDDVSSDGFVFGLGGTYYFTENFGLRGDITGYNTRDIVEAGYVGGSLGATLKF